MKVIMMESREQQTQSGELQERRHGELNMEALPTSALTESDKNGTRAQQKGGHLAFCSADTI